MSFGTINAERRSMRMQERYPGQFAQVPDPLYVAVPRAEVIAEMEVRGSERALNDICLSVAMVADVIARARDSAANSLPRG